MAAANNNSYKKRSWTHQPERVTEVIVLLFRIVRSVWDRLSYNTRTESIVSLKKLPATCQVCLNDVISASLPGVTGKDPTPKHLVWVDSTDIDYSPIYNAQNSAINAEISFHRQINYEPAKAALHGISFVSGKRNLGFGNLRVRTSKGKSPIVATAILLLGGIFWLAGGANNLIDLWHKINDHPGVEKSSIPLPTSAKLNEQLITHNKAEQPLVRIEQNSSAPFSPNIIGNSVNYAPNVNVQVNSSPQRTLPKEKRARLVEGLKKAGRSTISFRVASGCLECQRYADFLAEAIREAGWEINPHPKFLIQQRVPTGLDGADLGSR